MGFASVTSNPAVLMFLYLAPLYCIGIALRNLAAAATKIKQILKTCSDSHVVLLHTPCQRFASMFTVCFAMSILGLKHLGFGARLGNVRPDGTIGLPALSITAPIVITMEEIKAYERATRTIFSKCDSSGPGTATPGWTPLLLLAPLTTPLLPSLLLLSDNPIKPLGSVNVRNVFVFHRPDVLHMAGLPGAKASAMQAEAKMGGGEMPGRCMKRGVEYDTVIRVSASDGAEGSAIADQPVFTFTFTTLSLVRLSHSAPLYQPTVPLISQSEPAWQFDPLRLILSSSSAPRPWASLSKDYNPIHVSPLLAKLFGFKQSIAHGNMVLALVMQRAVDNSDTPLPGGRRGDDPRAVLGKLWGSPTAKSRPSWLVVDFRRPVFVPSALKIRWAKGRAQVYEETGTGSKPGMTPGLEQVRILVDIHAGEGEAPSV
jgi:acyl dehydratase